MIAYVCGSDSWGGLEMNQWHNALWMKGRGYPVVVLGRAESDLESVCHESAIDFIPIGAHRKHYDLVAAWKLRCIIRNRKIAHLVIRDGRDMSVATIAKNLCFRKLKVHYFMEMQLGVVKKNIAQTLRFRQLDNWICPLNWLVEEVKSNTNMPHDRIHHIPVGIELQVFRSEMTAAEARSILKLPETGILLGLAGRIDEQKGQLLLLQAQKLLLDKGIPVTVVLLGSPTKNEGNVYQELLLDFVKESGLADAVFHLPFRKDHHVFYKAIDALVMASFAETCGMVTIEAMAGGTPVIGSNAGGTAELLQHGKTGYLFETRNPASLAEQIELFLLDPKKFRREDLIGSMDQFDHNKVCEMVVDRLFDK